MLNPEEAQMAECSALGEEDTPTGAAETVIPDRSHLRVLEALLFAAAEPVDESALARMLPPDTDVATLLAILKDEYSSRGVNLVRVAGKWQFRTAGDLAFLLRKESVEQHKLSRAAIETLAIIAYHQPVTRADIEGIRGVMVSKGTIDLLLEAGWIRIRGRRRSPGRPVTYGTTEAFLAFLLRKESVEQHKLSRAAIETLAIIAYHQSVTRADIEGIRGVMVSKGTIDLLLEAGWIRIRGRRRSPGRPVTYGTTEAFLAHFGLEEISDLPGVDELKAAGFLDSVAPSAIAVPQPSDDLTPDEELYDGDEDMAADAELTSE